jgi:hypothetical protein
MEWRICGACLLAYAPMQTPSTSPTVTPTTLTLQPTRVRAGEEEETGHDDMDGSEVAVVLLTLIAMLASFMLTPFSHRALRPQLYQAGSRRSCPPPRPVKPRG